MCTGVCCCRTKEPLLCNYYIASLSFGKVGKVASNAPGASIVQWNIAMAFRGAESPKAPPFARRNFIFKDPWHRMSLKRCCKYIFKIWRKSIFWHLYQNMKSLFLGLSSREFCESHLLSSTPAAGRGEFQRNPDFQSWILSLSPSSVNSQRPNLMM